MHCEQPALIEASVMRRSWLFLQARYRALHCFGAALCLASVALLVLTDTSVPRSDRAKPLAGDCLVLLGALLYAGCNVTQEKLLRKSSFFSPHSLLLLLACRHAPNLHSAGKCTLSSEYAYMHVVL